MARKDTSGQKNGGNGGAGGGKSASPVVERVAVEEVALRVEVLATAPTGYVGRHVEVQLDAYQAAVMDRVFRGQDEAGVRLRSGRRVGSKADAWRYVLEQIGAAVGMESVG